MVGGQAKKGNRETKTEEKGKEMKMSVKWAAYTHFYTEIRFIGVDMNPYKILTVF